NGTIWEVQESDKSHVPYQISSGSYRSISAGTDHFKNAVAYGLTAGGSVVEFYPSREYGHLWETVVSKDTPPGSYSPGAIAAISAGNDDVLYAIAKNDHSLWYEQRQGNIHHWYKLDDWAYKEISAGTGHNGVENVVFGIDEYDSHLWEVRNDGSWAALATDANGNQLSVLHVAGGAWNASSVV